MTTFNNTESSGIPSEAWFQKQDEHEDDDEKDEDSEELKAQAARVLCGLLAWRSAGMRATVIQRYEDGSCDISMKSPSTGATVSLRVPHSFLVTLNAE